MRCGCASLSSCYALAQVSGSNMGNNNGNGNIGSGNGNGNGEGCSQLQKLHCMHASIMHATHVLVMERASGGKMKMFFTLCA